MEGHGSGPRADQGFDPSSTHCHLAKSLCHSELPAPHLKNGDILVNTHGAGMQSERDDGCKLPNMESSLDEVRYDHRDECCYPGILLLQADVLSFDIIIIKVTYLNVWLQT